MGSFFHGYRGAMLLPQELIGVKGAEG